VTWDMGELLNGKRARNYFGWKHASGFGLHDSSALTASGSLLRAVAAPQNRVGNRVWIGDIACWPDKAPDQAAQF